MSKQLDLQCLHCQRKTDKKRLARSSQDGEREREREPKLYFLVFIARVRSHDGGGKKGGSVSRSGKRRRDWEMKASVVMQRLSYPIKTVLNNKITRNRIVLSSKDSPRKPLGRRPGEGEDDEMAVDFDSTNTYTLILSAVKSMPCSFQVKGKRQIVE